uniref:Uncharacterized protein n=1 Tax=Cacopsylla melanoneura TaxID=428564 RepID=A0A8D9B401_9HEMI
MDISMAGCPDSVTVNLNGEQKDSVKDMAHMFYTGLFGKTWKISFCLHNASKIVRLSATGLMFEHYGTQKVQPQNDKSKFKLFWRYTKQEVCINAILYSVYNRLEIG